MSFDRLARHYRWMEFVLAGGKLQRCRTAFLDQIPEPKHLCLLGEGPGRALVACRKRFANARISCLDSSRNMLDEARRRLDRRGLKSDGIEFIHADILNSAPIQKGCDLVMTCFFLDCFRPDQLRTLVPAIASAIAETATWLIADFQIPATRLERTRSRFILWSMYRFFRVLTALPAKSLTSPDPFLQAAGFQLYKRQESEWGLLRSDWWRRML